MANPLMTEMLDGLPTQGGGFFRKITGAENNALATTSFQEVFDSIHQNNQESLRKFDEANNDPDYRTFNQNNNEKPEQAEASRKDIKERSNERVASVSDKPVDSPKPKIDDSSAPPSPTVTATHQPEPEQEGDTAVNDAVNQIMDKLKTMAQEDPDGLKALLDNIDNISFEDFLTGLGFTGEQVASLSETLNLSGKTPEQIVAALTNPDADNLATALRDTAQPNKGKEAFAPLANDVPKEQTTKSDAPKNLTEIAANDPDYGGDAKDPDTGKPKDTETPKMNMAQEKKKEIVAEAKVEKAAQMAEKPVIAPKDITAAVVAAKAQATAPNAVAAAAKASGAPANHSDIGATAAQAKGETSATEAKEKSQAAPPPRRDFDRMLVSQVIEKARIALKPGGPSQLTVRLDPPSLGKIDVRVIVEENSVRAVLMTENREVKAAIEQNLNHLRHALSQNGMKVDQINVTTADDGGLFFSKQNTSGQDCSDDHSDGGRSSSTETGQAAAESDNVHDILTRRATHQGALDVVA